MHNLFQVSCRSLYVRGALIRNGLMSHLISRSVYTWSNLSRCMHDQNEQLQCYNSVTPAWSAAPLPLHGFVSSSAACHAHHSDRVLCWHTAQCPVANTSTAHSSCSKFRGDIVGFVLFCFLFLFLRRKTSSSSAFKVVFCLTMLWAKGRSVTRVLVVISPGDEHSWIGVKVAELQQKNTGLWSSEHAKCLCLDQQ